MKKRGQIWIETVLYTLIGMALIGMVLAFITPKINESRDKIIVDQSIDSLNGVWDDKMNVILEMGEGNSRKVEFKITKGELIIDPVEEKVSIVLSGLQNKYSEVAQEVEIGRVKITTEEMQKDYTTRLVLDYSEITDITFDGENGEVKRFYSAPVPYSFLLTNEGTHVNIEEISGR